MGTSAVERFMRRRNSDLAAALPSSASFTLKFLLQQARVCVYCVWHSDRCPEAHLVSAVGTVTTSS